MLYVNNNGTILPADQPTIYTGNRGYLYGDGVFESIRVINGKPVNLENHIKRLIEGAKRLKMRPPSYFDTFFFRERIIELLQKCGIREGGRCRVHLDRIAGGAYYPDSNEVTFYIETYPLDTNYFELNSKGLEIDIFLDHKKAKTSLSNFKTKNGLIYVLASISAREKGLDDYLITNYSGGILEGTASNMFVISNGVLYTPGLEEGCLAGTMRMQVINLALENNIKVYECNILPQNLLVADEILLTNAIVGIQWVMGYRTKRYSNSTAKQLVDLLNEKWKNREL